jgi:hypothetical protein
MGLGGGGGGGVNRLKRSEKKRRSGNPSRSNCVRSIALHKQAERERERERVEWEVETWDLKISDLTLSYLLPRTSTFFFSFLFFFEKISLIKFYCFLNLNSNI